MHAIIESQPGDEPALFLLGSEQQVQETTELLGHLARGAEVDELSDESSSMSETFQALALDPFRDPRKLSDEAAAIAMGVLPEDVRAASEESYAASIIAQIDAGNISETDAENNLRRFIDTLEDVVVLNFEGVESEVTIGQLEPRQHPIIWDAQSKKRDTMDTGLGPVMPLLPARAATFEHPKEREIARSLGAIGFSKQFEIEWDTNGIPTLATGHEHKLLWIKDQGDLTPIATILSPDHPVRQPQQ